MNYCFLNVNQRVFSLKINVIYKHKNMRRQLLPITTSEFCKKDMQDDTTRGKKQNVMIDIKS